MCTITYKGKDYSEAEFYALLANGELDKLIEDGDIVLGKKEQRKQPSKKDIRSHWITVGQLLESQEFTEDKIKNNPMYYDAINNDDQIAESKDYIIENGAQNAYTDLITGKLANNQNEIVIGYMLYDGLLKEYQVSFSDQVPTTATDAIYEDMEKITEYLAHAGTFYGRKVQTFSLFLPVASDPAMANHFGKMKAEKANRAAKSDPVNKKSASVIAGAINKTVKKGIEKSADEVYQEVANKYKGKPRTREGVIKARENFNKSKARLKTAWDALKTTGIALDPKEEAKKQVEFDKALFSLAKDFIVYKNAQVTQFIKEVKDAIGDKVDADRLREVFTNATKEVDAEEIEKVVVSERLKRSAASAKEATALEAELQAERAKISALQAEEKVLAKESAKNIAEAERLKRAAAEAKESDSVRSQKEKELSKIAENKLSEALLAKEKVEAERLKRIQGELLDSKKREKELQDKKDELAKDIAAEKELKVAINDIIEDYLSSDAFSTTNIQPLIDLVSERLGVEGKEAEKIATQIRNSVVNNIRDKIGKKYESDIKREIKKRVPEKTEPKTPENVLDDFIKAAQLNALGPQEVMEIFSLKYGIMDYTQQDAKWMMDQAKKIGEQPENWRKAEEISNMVKYLADKSPVYLTEALTTAWYQSVLSAALLPVGTGDVNLSYNWSAFLRSAIESAFVNTQIGLKTSENTSKGIVNGMQGWLFSLGRAFGQGSPVDDINANLLSEQLKAIKDHGMMESATMFLQAWNEGTGSFREYEKPFEGVKHVELEFDKLLKKSKEGDKVALQKLIGFQSAVLRIQTNVGAKVTRMLAAQDLFFQGAIRNMQLYPLLREKYYKEGLRGEELNQKIIADIFNTKQEHDIAVKEAIDARKKYDITSEMKIDAGGKTYYEVTDKGDVLQNEKSIRSLVGIKREPKKFDTKEEADAYVEEIASSGVRFKRDIVEFLNNKIDQQIQKQSSRISGTEVLTNRPYGWTGDAFVFFEKMRLALEKKARINSSNARTANDVTGKVGYESLARSAAGLSLLFAFMKVGMNNIRMKLNYTPAGYARAKYGSLKSLATKEIIFDDYTDTEKAIYNAKATYGLIATGLAIAPMFAMVGGDDDESKDKVQKTIDEYNKQFGTNFTIESPLFRLPQKGDICGSMNMLTPAQQAFFKKTGLSQEYSEYDGGKWVSKRNDPTYLTRFMLASAFWQNKYITNNPNIVDKPTGEGKKGYADLLISSLLPVELALDLGAAKGLGNTFKYESGKGLLVSAGETVFMWPLQIGNPRALGVTLQTIDGTVREYPNKFQDTKKYVLSKYIPVYSSFYSVSGLEKKYGMFGEEQYRIPSQAEGKIAQQIYDLRFSDKNKEEKAIYDFLAVNGYQKVSKMQETKQYTTIGDDGIPVTKFITNEQLNRLGQFAGRESFEEIKQKIGPLQDVFNQEGKGAFVKEIDGIFNKWYNYNWDVETGKIKPGDQAKAKAMLLFQEEVKGEREAANAEKEAYLDLSPEDKALKSDFSGKSFHEKVQILERLKENDGGSWEDHKADLMGKGIITDSFIKEIQDYNSRNEGLEIDF